MSSRLLRNHGDCSMTCLLSRARDPRVNTLPSIGRGIGTRLAALVLGLMFCQCLFGASDLGAPKVILSIYTYRNTSLELLEPRGEIERDVCESLQGGNFESIDRIFDDRISVLLHEALAEAYRTALKSNDAMNFYGFARSFERALKSERGALSKFLENNSEPYGVSARRHYGELGAKVFRDEYLSKPESLVGDFLYHALYGTLMVELNLIDYGGRKERIALFRMLHSAGYVEAESRAAWVLLMYVAKSSGAPFPFYNDSGGLVAADSIVEPN